MAEMGVNPGRSCRERPVCVVGGRVFCVSCLEFPHTWGGGGEAEPRELSSASAFPAGFPVFTNAVVSASPRGVGVYLLEDFIFFNIFY